MKRILISLLILSFIVTISAFPPIPEKYWGYAYLDGELVSAGTSITVKVTGTSELVGSNLSGEGGLYSLDIIFDDPDTAADEGADNNDQLTWYISGNECTTPASGDDTAINGTINSNFNIQAESGGCELDGDDSPCGVVTLAEVVDFITTWDLCVNDVCPPGEDATLAEVVDLITAWDLCTQGMCPT